MTFAEKSWMQVAVDVFPWQSDAIQKYLERCVIWLSFFTQTSKIFPGFSFFLYLDVVFLFLELALQFE